MTLHDGSSARDSRSSVSIIVPMLNEAEHIKRLVADVAAQDYPAPIELVVADGGSCDGSVEISYCVPPRA